MKITEVGVTITGFSSGFPNTFGITFRDKDLAEISISMATLGHLVAIYCTEYKIHTLEEFYAAAIKAEKFLDN